MGRKGPCFSQKGVLSSYFNDTAHQILFNVVVKHDINHLRSFSDVGTTLFLLKKFIFSELLAKDIKLFYWISQILLLGKIFSKPLVKFKLLLLNKRWLFTCPALLPYCHSVSLSLCLSGAIYIFLSDWISDILLTVWTTFVLITKLKSRSVFYLSVCLSVSLSFYVSIFLTSRWHSEQLLFW